MGQLDESGQLTPFPWGRATKNSITNGIAATVASGLMSLQTGDALTASFALAGTFGATFAGTFFGEFTNHTYDDPHPTFDRRTTVLFNLVGMTLCFFIFVVPAMILGALVTPGTISLPGFFGYAAFCLSGFFVAIVRGLLINLHLVRDEDYDKKDPDGSIITM
ncbi:hypothetical protein [Magnetovibrio sp.]|uniref:hypothetical protein n=1 Tax=Magnetovibrio sp. TaxID=2024836 RepID=UPI002F945DEC